MDEINDFAKDKSPVQIMNIINHLIGVMSAKGALVHDDNDEDWFLHHLEYREDVDEIFFLCDTRR